MSEIEVQLPAYALAHPRSTCWAQPESSAAPQLAEPLQSLFYRGSVWRLFAVWLRTLPALTLPALTLSFSP
eukprot:COSAG04_NODE_133_length_23964_cov_7.547999_14_plen_71_part_00